MADDEKPLAARVLGYRRAGATFDVIAERIEVTEDVARDLFAQAVGDVDLAYVLGLELDRLDRLHAAAWPAAAGGDLKAIEVCVRLSERREKLASARNLRETRDAYDSSVATAPTLPMDNALIESGRQVADTIDAAKASGSIEARTKAAYLTPHMLNVLRELLATPASRHNAGITAKPEEDGTLGQLRMVHRRADKG